MGAERARSDVVDHEAQMVNARVARRVPGTLARVLSPGLEDREIDVPFPLMGLVPRLRIVEAVADMELVGEDRKGRLRIRAATRRSSHSAHHRPRTITTPEASRIAITTLATVKTARRLARRRTRLPGGRAALEDHAFRSVPPSGAPDLLPLPQRLRQRRLHHRACDRVPAHLKDGTDEALDAEPKVLPAGVSHARHRS